jgi:hypothetical protein
MISESFKEDLALLEIVLEENKLPSLRFVNLKFKKLAKIHHPDKGGKKEEFQIILNAYRSAVKHLEDVVNGEVEDDDAHFEKEFFKRNNFPKENKTSFTVILENSLSGEWRDTLKNTYGEGEKLVNGGEKFSRGSITMTFYEKPKRDGKTKVLVQSGVQDENFDFVFNEMPKLYMKVRQQAEKRISLSAEESSDKGRKLKSLNDNSVHERLKNAS